MLMCSFVYAQAQIELDSSQLQIKLAHDTSTSIPTLKDTIIDPMDTLTLKVSPSALKSRVTYTADDSMPYDAESKKVYLYKNAKVRFENLSLDADFIIIDFDKNLMTAIGTPDSTGKIIGKPFFKQGEAEYRADTIKYNYNTKKGYLSEFRTKEGEGYIHGESVKKDEENNFGIKDAKYTTCELEHPHYFIGATKIKVVPEKKIVTGPAELWIEDVPTPLLLPFGIFSIKRGQSSGLIIPTYGNALGRGYFLRDGGYYFGLGESSDLRLTGDIYTNLSWAARAGYRYLSRYHFNGNLLLSYANNKNGLEGDPGYTTSKDFQITWQHAQDPKARPNTSFGANVNIVSVNNEGNSFLANNSYNPQNIVTNQLQSSISFQKGFKNGKYNLSANGRMSQNTSTRDVNIALPDITFTVASFAPFKSRYKNTADKWYENIQANYSVVFRNDLNTKDSILFRNFTGNELVNFLDTAARFGMQHRSQVQTSFKVMKFYTLSLSTDMNEYWYLESIRKDTNEAGNERITRVNGFKRAFTYSPRAALSTRYYGLAQFKSGKLKAIRHVVTPTLDFSYTPDFADESRGIYQTYTNRAGREVRYSIFERGIMGGPGAGRQGNIGFGLDNNLELKLAKKEKDTSENDRKLQLLESIRAGAAWNIFADSFNLSNINLSGRTKLFQNIMVNANANVDPYRNEILTQPNGFKSIYRVHEFQWNNNRSIGTLTSASLGLNASFNPQTFKAKNAKKRDEFESEMKYIQSNPMEFYDFDVPWNLNLTYSINYNKYNTLNNPEASNFNQTLNFNGDVNLTPNWKIGYTSGYDIKNKQVTFTSIDFVRKIHCWEFSLNWIPIGFRQSFMFKINVKSTLLQDLRMTRRRDWYDRTI